MYILPFDIPERLHKKCNDPGYVIIIAFLLILNVLKTQEDAIEQCRKMDSQSTLFRYTQAELDSVVLHMNNGNPIVSIFFFPF